MVLQRSAVPCVRHVAHVYSTSCGQWKDLIKLFSVRSGTQGENLTAPLWKQDWESTTYLQGHRAVNESTRVDIVPIHAARTRR